MTAAQRTANADPAPDERPGGWLRPQALALGVLAAAVSAAAVLWLAFAPRPQDGSLLPVLLSLALALIGPLGWVGAMIMAGSQAKAARAEALKQRQHHRQAMLNLLDLVPVAMALCDPKPGLSSVNRAMAQLLRIEGETFAGLNLDWQCVMAAEDGPAWRETCATAQQSGRAQWLRCTLQAGGGDRPVLAQIAPWDGESGAELAISLMPREGESGLVLESVLHLRDLLGLAEAEKWSFGQAVHDELGQRLSGMAYFAKSLQRKLQQAQRTEAEDAGWLTVLANESMSVARGLARGLVPVGSDDPDALTAALSDLCESTRRSFSIRCELHVDPGFNPGSVAQANHLYHAVQELITNACKHGHAGLVQVNLAVEDEGQRVAVRDDGQGFGPATSRSGGMGLNGVRSRVAYLGGRFVLSTTPGGGVLATITLPLPAAAE